MISIREIKERASKFAFEWAEAKSEKQQSQSFWIDFFKIFDVSSRSLNFEFPIKNADGNSGFIDLFWRGQLLIEHKTKGRNLDEAKNQAFGYLMNIREKDMPKYILVSDFNEFWLFDLDSKEENRFYLKDLAKNIDLFLFIAGYVKRSYKDEEPTNRLAAELMGKLHDKLFDNGYRGSQLELFLTRLLFCMFAEDTGIFPRDSFHEFIKFQTHETGRDLGSQINYLFELFDTPNEQRQKNLDSSFSQFPYINGNIFRDQLRMANFDKSMREILLEACSFDWSQISPSIFGSMFQASMDVNKRAELGSHFTSETNILKAIKPLFLDDLFFEFEKVKNSPVALNKFHDKISKLKFLDPACGSGNFLIVAFRELKLLEFEIMKISGNLLSLVHINQFFGFEIDELPSRITQTAMLLIDHQMNILFAQLFGESKFNIPIRENANIFNINALKSDWNDILKGENIDFIIGNPPFLGSKLQSKDQKSDMEIVFQNVKGYCDLDLVSAWYIKSAKYIQGKNTKVALVSTNSIAQGEQVGILWNELFGKYQIKIHFAHQTFQWNNEAKNNAKVHCVIIGFANYDISEKRLFQYETIKSTPKEISVANINPYLVESSDFLIFNRSKPISNVPEMSMGNQPIDDGNYIFTEEEKNEFIKKEPKSEKYFRLFLGSYEFLNNIKRYILWLGNIEPHELNKMPFVLERVKAVKKFRENSKSEPTRKLSSSPTIFNYHNMPTANYLAIPKTSSEIRKYIPIGYLTADIFVSDAIYILENATLYHFAILTSKMHMDFMRYVAGRLKSDYRYSVGIVYNNFPFPPEVSEKQKENIEKLSESILNIRAEFKNSSLANLYHPLSMPQELLKAHEKLDRAVDKLYKKEGFKNDSERVAFLFDLNQKLTNLLFEEKPKSKRRK